jgi:hypothetical protein
LPFHELLRLPEEAKFQRGNSSGAEAKATGPETAANGLGLDHLADVVLDANFSSTIAPNHGLSLSYGTCLGLIEC